MERRDIVVVIIEPIMAPGKIDGNLPGLMMIRVLELEKLSYIEQNDEQENVSCIQCANNDCLESLILLAYVRAKAKFLLNF